MTLPTRMWYGTSVGVSDVNCVMALLALVQAFGVVHVMYIMCCVVLRRDGVICIRVMSSRGIAYGIEV